jgi:hypothetical protein
VSPKFIDKSSLSTCDVNDFYVSRDDYDAHNETTMNTMVINDAIVNANANMHKIGDEEPATKKNKT